MPTRDLPVRPDLDQLSRQAKELLEAIQQPEPAAVDDLHAFHPNVRESFRKQLHPGYGEEILREYHNVTPLAWGRQFHR